MNTAAWTVLAARRLQGSSAKKLHTAPRHFFSQQIFSLCENLQGFTDVVVTVFTFNKNRLN